MKQSEAVKHLREMMWALQRYRSITLETVGPGTGQLHLSKKLAGEMWPWVFGEKCPLPALSKILDNVDSGKDLAPGDYYNMMYVLDSFMPEVKIMVHTWRGVYTVPEGPPDISVMRGWEDEPSTRRRKT